MATKTKPKRRIVKADIKYISLCSAGANNLNPLYKSLQEVDNKGNFTFGTIFKEIEEGKLSSVVYAPNYVDAHGDITYSDAIDGMMESFAKHLSSGEGGIDFEHDGNKVSPEDAYILETYKVKKNDPDFSDLKDKEGNPVNAEGAWAVTMKIDSPDLRSKIKKGDIGGISMGGVAQFETLKEEEEVEKSLLVRLINKLFGEDTPSSENSNITLENMDKSEFAEMLTEALSKAVKAVTSVKPEGEAEVAKTQTKVPEFTGDRSSKEDVEKHLQALKLSKIDMTDIKSVEGLLKSMDTENEHENPENEDLQKQIDALKDKIKKNNQRSNQTPLNKKEGDTESFFSDQVAKSALSGYVKEDK